mmetsp:Transcript_58126/g.66346  ORF Transcript_58126/g.66346 Transcript_58126/m.66346 type:complete len:173 (+) Transcript_58126:36-554(+)
MEANATLPNGVYRIRNVNKPLGSEYLRESAEKIYNDERTFVVTGQNTSGILGSWMWLIERVADGNVYTLRNLNKDTNYGYLRETSKKLYSDDRTYVSTGRQNMKDPGCWSWVIEKFNEEGVYTIRNRGKKSNVSYLRESSKELSGDGNTQHVATGPKSASDEGCWTWVIERA